MALKSRKSLERAGRSVPKVRNRKDRDWDDKPPADDAPAPVVVESVFDPSRPYLDEEEVLYTLQVLFRKMDSRIRGVVSRQQDRQEVNKLHSFFDDEPPGQMSIEMREHNTVISDVGDTNLTAREVLAYMEETFLKQAMTAKPAQNEIVLVVCNKFQFDEPSSKLTFWFGVGIDPSVGAVR